MAINWTEYEVNSNEVKRTWTTHEGLVVSPATQREARVMSDVYAMVSSCIVWDAATGTTKSITLGTHFECCTTFGEAVVDASADIVAEVARQDAEAEDALAAQQQAWVAEQARLAAEARHNTPQRGMQMRVIRGRKTLPGTEGKVFWLDDYRNPTRVGLALSDRKVNGRHTDVAWVDAAYLVNTAPMAYAQA